MSIFSKLFPGDAKGETDAATAAPSSAAEKGPAMQRPPKDEQAPGAPATLETQKQKPIVPPQRPPANKPPAPARRNTRKFAEKKNPARDGAGFPERRRVAKLRTAR